MAVCCCTLLCRLDNIVLHFVLRSVVSDRKDNSWCHAGHTSQSALSKTGGCDMADMCDVSKAQGVVLHQHVDQPDS